MNTGQSDQSVLRPQTVVRAIRLAAVLLAIVGFALQRPGDGGLSRAQVGSTVQGSLDSPEITLTLHVGGLDRPVHVTHAGDGSGRLFIVEQPGRIRIFRDGALLATPFLNITERASCCGERGLLSLAFPPDYSATGVFYVNYTNGSGHTVVARYRTGDDPDRADPGSEEVLLTVRQPYPNHNGGQLAFSPMDGYLYIGMGDGGSAGDPQNHAQNPGSLLGKMLRIDVSSGAGPYAVPPNNPYTQAAGYSKEIWALGLRNPWRFSFDSSTGDLYVGDVGQGQWEEINFQPASSSGGENYGWRIMEGAHCYQNPNCSRTGLVLPVAEYDHGQGCSVTGGIVYRGQRYPRMQGVYFYGDYCSGRMWALRRSGQEWQTALVADTPYRISSFGEDEAGEQFVVDYGGAIYRIADTVVATPTAIATSTSSPTTQPTGTLPPAHSPSPTTTATNAVAPTLTPSATDQPTSTSTVVETPSQTVPTPIWLPIIWKA